ncbi:peptidase M17, leucyl aminopeptidase [Neoconidiobolus thromboides FSU 785]|nr:peptidase M17, leucyl aminopeptidase [Neoconidiobolus thromboides FSU 785]
MNAIETNLIILPFCSAVARAFPLYTRKTKSQSNKTLTVNFVGINGTPLSDINLGELQVVSENIRLAARLSDMPCSELNTNTYIEEVKAAIKGLDNVKLEIIQGEELNQRGFGGLWGVGKAAVNLPALVILSYEPTNKNETSKRIALVGKGICYDTGGLSLKSTTGMPGMKVDMAGSAAVLGSFLSLVKNQTSHTVFGLLCLAENSCDQLSTRPDDILDMYSGVTVEVNNTDAEGRLVLGDGVSYASKHLEVDQIIDIATLTGAQIITTGPNHAGVMSNQEGYETKVVKAGHITGDLAFPMIYSKEFLLKELESEVADLKNSNKNGPTTAASSLAGHFIEAHLDKEYKGVWCHVDIAGPASKKHRCTGFGVALLYELVKQQN